MYLVSIYFDEKTNEIIKRHINQVAEHTGNTFMIDAKVPPHITISAFETREEGVAIEALERAVSQLTTGTITWASVGQFFPYVLYLAPVLNKYLHQTSVHIFESLSAKKEISVNKYYQPFQWMPHTTIGKKLRIEEMRTAFAVLQNSFCVFDGAVTEIGLAKPNPHRDIIRWKI